MKRASFSSHQIGPNNRGREQEEKARMIQKERDQGQRGAGLRISVFPSEQSEVPSGSSSQSYRGYSAIVSEF